MQTFAYGQAAHMGDALAEGAAPDTIFLAGGTELLNWLRLGIAKPTRVIDLMRSRALRISRPCRKAGSALERSRGLTTLRFTTMSCGTIPCFLRQF
jgi:CO/xanthine dehydrogenase FAD-binding subunit